MWCEKRTRTRTQLERGRALRSNQIVKNCAKVFFFLLLFAFVALLFFLLCYSLCFHCCLACSFTFFYILNGLDRSSKLNGNKKKRKKEKQREELGVGVSESRGRERSTSCCDRSFCFCYPNWSRNWLQKEQKREREGYSNSRRNAAFTLLPISISIWPSWQIGSDIPECDKDRKREREGGRETSARQINQN